MVTISIINACTVLTDAQISAALPALQKQVFSHFYPAWGLRGTLKFVPKGSAPAKGTWWIAILDNSDVSGALGYHDLTSDGLPIGKVFAGTVKQYGASWTVTLSHELLEMLADPDINLAAQTDDTTFYAREVCDPCESDSQGYLIDGVRVSDFVTPEWFEKMPHPTGTKFDYRRLISKPLGILTNGYTSILKIGSLVGWVQTLAKTADKHKQYTLRPKVGSRNERRALVRGMWVKSAPLKKPMPVLKDGVKGGE